MTTGLPPDFPANTLPVMRALCAIAASDTQQQQSRLTRALDALFARHWVDAVATHKPEVLKQTLVGLFGEAETEKSNVAPSPRLPPVSQFLSRLLFFSCCTVRG
jgi:2-hydroxychromene-2-carboxylate isomerase